MLSIFLSFIFPTKLERGTAHRIIMMMNEGILNEREMTDYYRARSDFYSKGIMQTVV